MLFNINFLAGLIAGSLAISNALATDLVPSNRQAEYSRVVSDVFLANACEKRFDFPGIFDDATHVFLIFARENNFPDAENLVRVTALQVKERFDDSAPPATEILCINLRQRINIYLKET